ncbi:hypothetical protein IEQ34_007803 [Dendrobium chrysotoxum]|uniref:Uncharacterized protein n=1 Tax=Dendrobium chrysotoxum TaxID=161865 RepID=A0AAV7H420_DENCH|nr:hypothetical protein IEQ34_007803 [Dendrobium chrysotoxum]
MRPSYFYDQAREDSQWWPNVHLSIEQSSYTFIFYVNQTRSVLSENSLHCKQTSLIVIGHCRRPPPQPPATITTPYRPPSSSLTTTATRHTCSWLQQFALGGSHNQCRNTPSATTTAVDQHCRPSAAARHYNRLPPMPPTTTITATRRSLPSLNFTLHSFHFK